MRNPLFSCVIPVKGPRPFLNEALSSLLAQGMRDELEIIVQDGDVDNNICIEDIEGVKWFQKEDNGQSDALNKGFAKATGEWFFWLNADDVLLPGALKCVVSKMNGFDSDANVEWIAGDTVYLGEDGVARDVRTDAKWRPWFGRYMSVWTGGPSAFFKRDLFERYGGFKIGLEYVMDIDLWTRWASEGIKFEGIEKYLWGFRMHEDSKTMGGRNNEAHWNEKKKVLKAHGMSKQLFWRNATRLLNLMDGSWLRRVRDARRFRGVPWRDLQV